jgi:hypothetical protein
MRIMVVIAVLFNPLLPMQLGKLDWVFVNLIVICLFITSLIKINKKEPNFNIKLVRVILRILFL